MQSLERSIGILRALAAAGRTELRLSDVARAVQLSKATTSRILAALCDQGLVEESRETKKFHLARPVLEKVAEATGDTAFLIVRSGTEAVCADRVSGSYPVKVFTMEVGSRRPLGVGSGGLALLAALPDVEVDQILKANAQELARFKAMRAARIRREVQQTRAREYAFAEGHVVK